ncbi:hypothetical protein GCM10027289_30980 [Tsukamurella serpentis]
MIRDSRRRLYTESLRFRPANPARIVGLEVIRCFLPFFTDIDTNERRRANGPWARPAPLRAERPAAEYGCGAFPKG